MDREIKFRAYANDIMIKDAYLSCHGVTDHVGNTLMGSLLMQYTGLKDRNGVEIYEGDILSNPAGFPCLAISVVKFDIEKAMFVATDRRGGWIVKAAAMGSCEIIGNIYENTDLLEKWV